MLVNKHGTTPENAFGLYDTKDTGLTSLNDFKRILKIFFKEVLDEETKDIDFITKLAKVTPD